MTTTGSSLAADPWAGINQALEPLDGLRTAVVQGVQQRMLESGDVFVETRVKPALEKELARAKASAESAAKQEEAAEAALAAVQEKEVQAQAALAAKKQRVAEAEKKLQDFAKARNTKLRQIDGMRSEECYLADELARLDGRLQHDAQAARTEGGAFKSAVMNDVDNEMSMMEVRLAGARYKLDKAKERLAALTAKSEELAGEPAALEAARAEFEEAERKYVDGIKMMNAQISKLKWAFHEVLMRTAQGQTASQRSGEAWRMQARHM